MKKLIFLLPVVSLTFLLIGCHNSGNENGYDTDNNEGEISQDAQVNDPDSDSKGDKEKVTISDKEAENILREYLVSANILKSDYVLEPFDPILGEFQNEELFRFEMRHKEDAGGYGGNLIANYDVSADGERIYWYNPADDELVLQNGNGSADKAVFGTETNTGSLIKAVLLGDVRFLYVSDGNTEVMDVTDIPIIFDAADPSMKVWNFSVVDMDGDGEAEVILLVAGAAGDMGGNMILHQIGDEVYGYTCDNRTLEELKVDGTFSFSDPTGVAEGGIGEIVDFSEFGYTMDKISYGSGTHEGWDTFIVDHEPATEEEYFDAADTQSGKPDVAWYDFTNENICAVF